MEIYLYYRYPDASSDHCKMEKFFGEGKIPVILSERINNEYSHLSGTIERGSMPIEVPEMVTAAKYIISKLRAEKDQFAALLNSIGVNETLQ